MQKTYDRITIPKIVICSKSTLEDCMEPEECERKSLIQRKMMRSRSRRHSRRFSSSIAERRSPSSSRSPSPSYLLSQSQEQSHDEEKSEDNYDNQDFEKDKTGQLEVKTDSCREVDKNDEKKENCIVERLQNGRLVEYEDNERSDLKLEGNKRDKSLRSNGVEDHKRSSKCNKCIKCQSNREETCLENCSGYQQYLRLLEVPQINLEWGEGSGDDLSSEWDSDHTDRSNEKKTSKVTTGNGVLPDILNVSFYYRTIKFLQNQYLR